MKKLVLVLFVVVGFMACNSPEKGANGVTYKTPVEYNDYIIGKQTILLERIMKFADAAKVNLDSADKLLDKYSAEAAIMIKDIKGMPGLEKILLSERLLLILLPFTKKLLMIITRK